MKDNTFTERLLAQEKTSSLLEDRYRKDLNTMLDRTLKPVERIVFGIVAVLGLVFIIPSFIVTWKTWGDVPAMASAGVFSGAVFALACGLFGIRVLRKGRLNLRKDMSFFAGLVWIFMVLMMTLFLMLGQQMENADKGTQLILAGLVFFVAFGVVGMLQYNIQQAELRTREAILRLEQQVATLAERLAPRD